MIERSGHRISIPPVSRCLSETVAPAVYVRVRELLLFIALITSAAAAAMNFLAPRPDEFVRIDEFLIAVGIPPESKRVRVYFDGKELDRLQRASATVTFIPDEVFLSRTDLVGPHRISIRRYGEYAALVEEQSVMVYLVVEDTLTDAQRAAMIEQGKALLPAGKPIKPLPFHNGRVATWFEYETFNDTGKAVAEADAWGNGCIGDFKYDYNLTLRTDEQVNYQTLQRFRAAVGYRSIARLSVGDNWPAYHQAILQQQRVRGMEVNLQTPHGFAGLDFVWGQAQRAIEPFVGNESALAACTTHNDSVGLFSAGTYRRDLKALRLSFGSPKLLTGSITLCKARDDTASINQLRLVDTSVNATTVTGRTPMDNLVYGADALLSLFHGRTQLFGSFAMSWTTTDISDGPLTSEEMDRYFDPDANLPRASTIALLLIINESTTPLPLPVDSGAVVNINSLVGAMNWDAGIRLRLPVTGAGSRADVKYYYIGPNYRSLGNRYLSSDRAGWLVNAETNLIGGRLFLKGKLNWFNKDLFEITATPTRVVHSSLSGAFTPQPFLPTLMLLCSVNDERSRTDNAADPDRNNLFYTAGGSLQYAPQLGKVTPSLSLSYYNSSTKITTGDLVHPFSMRTHTVVANLTTVIENVRLEPCAYFTLNATTEDVPLTLFSVFGGSRLHIIPKTFISDLLVGITNTDDPQSGKQNALSLKGSGRYELSERHSLWIDAGLKWNLEKDVDRRFRLNYELRY